MGMCVNFKNVIGMGISMNVMDAGIALSHLYPDSSPSQVKNYKV